MRTNIRLSVIIPCYNAAETIEAQLEAFAEECWEEPWELLIADNGSTDDTLEIVNRHQEHMPHLRIVDGSHRRGQAHARNCGVREAHGDLLAFCDADDVIAPGWVAAMGRALINSEFVACRFDVEKLNAPWVRASRNNPQGRGVQKYTNPPYLNHAAAAGLGIRRSLHEAVGGFDETVPVLDDTDYCWRVQLSGAELTFVSDAVIHYRYRSSLHGIYAQAKAYGMSNVLLYKKFRPRGMPRLSWKSGVKGWFRLATSVPTRMRSKEGRAHWLRQLGWRVGRLHGCIKYRVFAP